MRSKHRTFLPATSLFLLLSCEAFVCTAPATSQQAESERFSLRGKVINSATGEPVGGALVRIFDVARFSEADGTFVFSGLPRGSSTLFARRPGFFSEQELGRSAADPPVNIPTDTAVVVKLTPEGTIYGQVKDSDGQPLDGVTVKVHRWRIEDGRRQLRPEREATTDDEGNFRLAELIPGKYYLSFQLANGGLRIFNELSKKRQHKEGYGLQFYPGVADATGASVFEIHAGAEIRVTHSLQRQRLFQVSGMVRGANGQPFSLMLQDSSGEPIQRDLRINTQTGEFQVPGVPAGSYLLTAMMPRQRIENSQEPDPGPLTAMLPVHVSADLSGLVLALGSGTSVRVQVREELTNAGSDPHQVFLRLIPKEFAQNGQGIVGPPLAGVSRPPTRFEFENLVPGVYSVEATAQQGPRDYVAALRCGNVDLLRDDLAIAPGAAPPPIEVTLRDDAAQLNIALKEKGKPAAVVIYAEGYPKRSQLFPFNSYSESVLVFLPPGTYKVTALSDAADLEFRNPAAMEKYLSHATSATLQPLDKATISVEIQDASEQPQ